MTIPSKSAYNSALRLLARREHSAMELATKLKQRQFSSDEIQQAVLKCQQLNYQSDERFAEQLYNARVRQGYGPLRIQQELQSKGVNEIVFDAILHQDPMNIWAQRAMAVILKKFPEDQAVSWEDRQKRARFLMVRGFPMDLIIELMRTEKDKV